MFYNLILKTFIKISNPFFTNKILLLNFFLYSKMNKLLHLALFHEYLPRIKINFVLSNYQYIIFFSLSFSFLFIVKYLSIFYY